MAAGVIKFGPLTIHQNGQVVKSLRVTPRSALDSCSRTAHSLENVRLSLHLERFESSERFLADIQCIIRFPEFGYELKRETPCEMRVGQKHGAAVVHAMSMPVDLEHAHDTIMEVEFLMADQALEKHSVNIKFPACVALD